jgi:hypothetical protein
MRHALTHFHYAHNRRLRTHAMITLSSNTHTRAHAHAHSIHLNEEFSVFNNRLMCLQSQHESETNTTCEIALVQPLLVAAAVLAR